MFHGLAGQLSDAFSEPGPTQPDGYAEDIIGYGPDGHSSSPVVVLDTSPLVAILLADPEPDQCITALADAADPLISAGPLLEASTSGALPLTWRGCTRRETRLLAGAHTMSGVSGPDVPAPTTGARVMIQEIVSESYGSGAALARAFGQTVLEPSWWPADTKEIAYNLDGPPGQHRYRIGSTRAEGVPIVVVAYMEAAWAGRSPRDWLVGEWSEPPELAHLHGLIGRVGDPPRLQVVIYDQRLAIQLIGYKTEDEIMSAIRSLRPVTADKPLDVNQPRTAETPLPDRAQKTGLAVWCSAHGSDNTRPPLPGAAVAPLPMSAPTGHPLKRPRRSRSE